MFIFRPETDVEVLLRPFVRNALLSESGNTVLLTYPLRESNSIQMFINSFSFCSCNLLFYLYYRQWIYFIYRLHKEENQKCGDFKHFMFNFQYKNYRLIVFILNIYNKTVIFAGICHFLYSLVWNIWSYSLRCSWNQTPICYTTYPSLHISFHCDRRSPPCLDLNIIALK